MLLLSAIALLPNAVAAYNCGGSPWQTINVSLSSTVVTGLSTYTITTAVPARDGCNLTLSSRITIDLPGSSETASITGGTLNGNPITNFVSKVADSVTFVSPVAVNYNSAVTIVLNHVTNDSTPGSKTLAITASPVRNGSIGTTISNPFTLIIPTPTFTPTRTPTPTMTFTPTIGPTFTETPTPGLCTGPLGTNPCVPGGGARRTDCMMEWLTEPMPLLTRAGFPKNKLICYEGDPRCDFDVDLQNNSCLFHLRMCINNEDPRFSSCSPSDVKVFEVRAPRPRAVMKPADEANLLALEHQAGGDGLHMTVARKGVQIYVGSPNATRNACTGPIAVQLPLRVTPKGRVFRSFTRLRTRGVNSTGRVDADALRLECRPSTCGDGKIQADHESCDDGNRVDGDGCDRGCQREVPTPTLTSTVSPTPPPTLPGPSSTPSDTFTPSATFTPAPLSRTCNLRAGAAYSAVRIVTTLGLTLNVSLSGYQTWEFASQDQDGIRQITIPASGTHFNGVVVMGLIKICPRAGSDGSGFIDCDGGAPGYDAVGEWDHDTSNPPGLNGGHPQDPECDDTFLNPGGLLSTASLEGPTDLHPGVCNGPLRVTTSGTFAAGGMKLSEQLIIRILNDPAAACPADNTPLDEAAGDLSISGIVTTGAASGTVFDAMSNTDPWGLTATNLTDSSTGVPYGCANIDAGVLSTGKLNLSIPALDLSLSTIGNSDLVATLSLICR